MKFIMATEAQRLISISLAKIAASRCVRGGVSLHKNLLVATVLQKARYIFMEEAFHMVHGHYINQANSKFIQQLRHQELLENQLRQNDKEYVDEEDDSAALDDSELDLFSSPIDSNESLNFLSDSNCKDTGTIQNSTSNNNNNTNNKNITNGNSSSISKHNPSLDSTENTQRSDLIYLDLDVNNRSKSPENYDQNSNSITTGQKRRLVDDSSNYDGDNDNVLSIFPKNKQIKFSNNSTLTLTLNDEESRTPTSMTTSTNSNSKNNSDITSDNCLSLDFLSNDLNLTSGHHSPTHASNAMMTPLDMSNSTSALSTNTSNNPISPTSSSIDRITSLVSIFNFGNLQRSVSAPDLCSSSSNHSTVDNSCCNLQQRQIAMTV